MILIFIDFTFLRIVRCYLTILIKVEKKQYRAQKISTWVRWFMISSQQNYLTFCLDEPEIIKSLRAWVQKFSPDAKAGSAPELFIIYSWCGCFSFMCICSNAINMDPLKRATNHQWLATSFYMIFDSPLHTNHCHSQLSVRGMSPVCRKPFAH